MAKICVTGAAGFIGGHLAEELLREGHEVAGLDDFSSGKRENAELLARHPNFTLVEGSIADPDAALRAVAGATWVFHLAAIPSVPLSVAEPARTNAVNVGGTVNLLEIARKAGVQRVMLAGGSSSSNRRLARVRRPEVYVCRWTSDETSGRCSFIERPLQMMPMFVVTVAGVRNVALTPVFGAANVTLS